MRGAFSSHQTVLAQEGLVFGDAAEIRLLVFGIGRVGVVELLPLPFERGVGLFAVKVLPSMLRRMKVSMLR